MNVSASGIKQNLQILLELHHISKTELCKHINISQPTLSRILSGSIADPRASTLSTIAKYFDVSVDQLLGLQPIPKSIDKETTTSTTTFIPLFSWKDAATRSSSTDIKQYNKHRQWIETESFNKNCFSMKVLDDSMWPQFTEGTMLIINPALQPKNRDFIICRLAKERKVIFRQYLNEDNNKILRPINQALPSIKISKNDKIIGVVTQARNDFKVS